MVSSGLLIPEGIISLLSLRGYHQPGYSPRVSSVWLVPECIISLVSPRVYHQSG